MANNPAKYGFRCIEGKATPRLLRLRVASAYQADATGSVDLCVGDPLTPHATDGTVTLCAAGSAVCAVVAGILPFNRTLNGATYKDYGTQLPGGTTWTAQEDSFLILAYPVANVLFEVVADENTTATTLAAYVAFIGENADHILVRDATHLRANPKLDIGDHKQATAQWRIVDVGRRSTIDYSGTNVQMIVTANEITQAPWITTGT